MQRSIDYFACNVACNMITSYIYFILERTEDFVMLQDMNSSSLIEGCPAVSIGSLKHDLLRYRNREDNISGYLCIENSTQLFSYSYCIIYADDGDFLEICNSNDGSMQYINIAAQELYFGTRNYFICECGARCNRLYLPSNNGNFKCRNCHSLRYELSSINTSTIHGKLLYRTSRTIKLVNKRAVMNRIVYRSKYTHKYQSFLKHCNKAGLHEVIRDSENLMMAIQNQ